MTPADQLYYTVHNHPTLDHPVLVVALEGWIDAGLGAASAVAALLAQSNDETVVTFDSDHFIDQRARRPLARIVDGITTKLTWPQIQIKLGRDRRGAQVLYLVGPEPDFHWRAFIDAVVSLAVANEVRMVVGLGAFPGPAPHTRPVRLAATAPPRSSDLVNQVGIVQGELEFPAGIMAALEMEFAAASIDVVTLWARVPHYVAAFPFPEASAALVDGLAAVSGLALDSSELRRAADTSRSQIDAAVAANPEHVAMVRKLEEAIDASEGNPLGIEEVPSGDEIAAELERFLRGEGH